jgi:thiopeptide-type bacteriocin biosynthesis protein
MNTRGPRETRLPATVDPNWLQANVRLRRHDGSVQESARALFASLSSRVPRWRSEGLLSAFFFVRKPPDLRLRFRRGPSGLPPIACWLGVLVRGRHVSRWIETSYEPEARLLGGPAIMSLAHRYFHEDSSGWMTWVDVAERATVTAPVLSLAILNDLFFRVLEGPEEVWDVWCNLASLHGSGPCDSTAALRVLTIRDLSTVAAAPERRLLRQYARTNEMAAARMKRLLDTGELLCGRRSILPFLALFHWNRYGLLPRERASIYGGMIAALDPRRNLRGSDPDAGREAGPGMP